MFNFLKRSKRRDTNVAKSSESKSKQRPQAASKARTGEKREGTLRRDSGRADICSFYPYPTFRVGHRKALELIEENWKNFDVALIVAPMGSGKTAIRRAIAYWAKDVAMTVPNNNLLMQEIEEFPQTHKIFRKAFYHCPICYEMDLADVKTRKEPTLTVPHSYIAHRLGREVLIVDEGHKLVEINTDLQATHVWQKDINYPITTYNRADLEAHLRKVYNGEKKLNKLLNKLQTNDYMIKREVRGFRGKGQDRISIIPLYPETHPTLIKNTKKIILLSATLSDQDVYDLGIGRNRRILKIEIPSPIPAERRPLVLDFIASLHRYNLKEKAPAIARRIRSLRKTYAGKGKGLVHVTYELANYLRPYLESDPNYIFHTKLTAKKKLDEWMKSPASEGKVFIASGAEEGLNLDGSDYYWQAIAKISWASLADTAVRKKKEENEAWYYWQALKKVIQAYGRISRGPTDMGVTHIWDRSFIRLIDNAEKFGLIPDFFKEVLPK